MYHYVDVIETRARTVCVEAPTRAEAMKKIDEYTEKDRIPIPDSCFIDLECDYLGAYEEKQPFGSDGIFDIP